MRELTQAAEFYRSLPAEEKEELWQVLAEDIFFLDENLQQKILALLDETDPELGEEIRRRNSFTTN